MRPEPEAVELRGSGGRGRWPSLLVTSLLVEVLMSSLVSVFVLLLLVG